MCGGLCSTYGVPEGVDGGRVDVGDDDRVGGGGVGGGGIVAAVESTPKNVISVCKSSS